MWLTFLIVVHMTERGLRENGGSFNLKHPLFDTCHNSHVTFPFGKFVFILVKGMFYFLTIKTFEEV